MMYLLLLFVTATFRPSAPAVGDLITIDFREPVVLDRSADYEIVSQTGTRVVVRTFQPKPFALSGRMGSTQFRNLSVPVKSVLKPNDDLQPAPLKPPRELPYPRLPWIAIAIAAGCALAAWIPVVLLTRRQRRPVAIEDVIPPAERFRATIARLVGHEDVPSRWAQLADATRLYLASLSPHLGRELTSTQIVSRVDAQHAGIAGAILRYGDLEKFSPWGAPRADFDSVASNALTLIPPAPETEEVAA